MRNCIMAMMLILAATSTATQAEGFLSSLFQKKQSKEAAFQYCITDFESRERKIIIEAAAVPRGGFGSTYIPTDKGDWMIKCMRAEGFSPAFDSLSKLTSSELAGMSRETINGIKKADGDRAAGNIDGWK